MSVLSDINKKRDGTAKKEQKVSKTKDKDKTKKKSVDDKFDEDRISESTGQNQDITVYSFAFSDFLD